MTAQLDMFAGRDGEQAPAKIIKHGLQRPVRTSITERFEAFHAANRHVLDEMLRLAQARLAAGETRIGAKALWEELRSSLEKIADGGLGLEGKYKLDNSFTALYARKLIQMAPALADVIETRKRKAK